MISAPTGSGKCPQPDAPERRQSKKCNEMAQCIEGNPVPKCSSKADVVFVADSSGTVGNAGFAETKAWITSVVKRMTLSKEDGAQVLFLFF